jgi:hypothetical protein
MAECGRLGKDAVEAANMALSAIPANEKGEPTIVSVMRSAFERIRDNPGEPLVLL